MGKLFNARKQNTVSSLPGVIRFSKKLRILLLLKRKKKKKAKHNHHRSLEL